jgi:endo-1,4-beta-xylanase
MSHQNNGSSDGLRVYADAIGLKLGTAVDIDVLKKDDVYRSVLQREFNMIVAENCFKQAFVWMGPKEFDFSNTDYLASFAHESGMLLRGHTLLWHASMPKWLVDGDFSPSEIRDLLKNYIQTIVTRYKDSVNCWDVVNEAVSDDNGAMRPTFWLEKLGENYIEDAFRWAHEANPNASLYYNDYESEDIGPKSNTIYNIASTLVKNGAPIHGIGLQAHLLNGWRATDGHRSNIRRFADLGLDWQVTECDIRIELSDGKASTSQLEEQAVSYADLIALSLSEPKCSAFLVWGFADKYSWIPGFWKGWGASLPLDENFERKPAYNAIKRALISNAEAK